MAGVWGFGFGSFMVINVVVVPTLLYLENRRAEQSEKITSRVFAAVFAYHSDLLNSAF